MYTRTHTHLRKNGVHTNKSIVLCSSIHPHHSLLLFDELDYGVLEGVGLLGLGLVNEEDMADPM